MQILIAYAGKTGCTEKCAKMLESKLENAIIKDITKCDIDVSDYDLIIIGSSIRIGMFHSKIKKFINKNKDILLSKKIAYYICCGFSDNYKTYFENNVPKELLDKAIDHDTFGGEMDLLKQKGFDKFVVRLVSKTDEGKKEIKILSDNIDKFVDKIKSELK